MADRAGGESKPGVPKEVFELDKDERWQARLEEARARREIALRERAAGKAIKPRPKPWENDGFGSDGPKAPIDPIIQERGDDKFDFADRLETIREAEAKRPVDPPAPPAERPHTPVPRPPVPPATGRPAAPEPRARPQPSLVLPGAPDVADLAARYAATLDTAERLTSTRPVRSRVSHVPEIEEEPAAQPIVMPARPAAERAIAPAPKTRAARRRGIRPLGMAFGLLLFAALPLTTEAPPLEVGPKMPTLDLFRVQPALGVTWGLYERPLETSWQVWRPRIAPPLLQPLEGPLSGGIAVARGLAPIGSPGVKVSERFSWEGIAPVAHGDKRTPSLPALTADAVPEVGRMPAAPTPPRSRPVEAVAPTLAEPMSPDAEIAVPDGPDGSISAPPRPATLQNDLAPAPEPNAAPLIDPPSVETPINGATTIEAPADPAPVAPPDQTVVEADPLRVTILAPLRVDRAQADDIAANVARDGHELVRVRDVNFSISSRNVRFFHDSDRAAAARMAERYDAELRDFTWFRPRPVEGTAELWLAGRSSGNTSGRPQAGARVLGPNEVLNRVFDRLGLGTELPEVALPGAQQIQDALNGPRETGN